MSIIICDMVFECDWYRLVDSDRLSESHNWSDAQRVPDRTEVTRSTSLYAGSQRQIKLRSLRYLDFIFWSYLIEPTGINRSREFRSHESTHRLLLVNLINSSSVDTMILESIFPKYFGEGPQLNPHSELRVLVAWCRASSVSLSSPRIWVWLHL